MKIPDTRAKLYHYLEQIRDAKSTAHLWMDLTSPISAADQQELDELVWEEKQRELATETSTEEYSGELMRKIEANRPNTYTLGEHKQRLALAIGRYARNLFLFHPQPWETLAKFSKTAENVGIETAIEMFNQKPWTAKTAELLLSFINRHDRVPTTRTEFKDHTESLGLKHPPPSSASEALEVISQATGLPFSSHIQAKRGQ